MANSVAKEEKINDILFDKANVIHDKNNIGLAIHDIDAPSSMPIESQPQNKA
jgi:hypothetical protein